MKNLDLDFAINGAQKVLEKLAIERTYDRVKGYKTLTQSFSEYVYMLKRQKPTITFHAKIDSIREKVVSEISNLEKVIEKAIDKNDYRSHYEWVLCYRKLIQLRDDMEIRQITV